MWNLIPFLAAASVLSTGAAGADCGEELLKLLADDGAKSDFFGRNVAISGGTAIVGAALDDDNGDRSGSAYVFDAATGKQIAKLVAGDGAPEDFFGFPVAIDGATAIVGSWQDDDNGPDSGSAYLFDTTTGQQIAKLLPDDGAEGDFFGVSMAISGTTAIVGAYMDDDNGEDSGSAYLFDITTGEQIGKLLPDDGAEGDNFGLAVAISGVTAIVGAWQDDDNGTDSGSAYLFDLATGEQIGKLLQDDGAEGDLFGVSVAIRGTIVVVGAAWDDENGQNSGSAYVFDISNPKKPRQTAKLLATDGAVDDFFGFSVAISGTTAIVGASGDDDNGNLAGSAYLFDTSTGRQVAKLLPDDGAAGDQFGISVAISGASAIAGGYGDDDNGSNSGSAYLFDVGGCAVCMRDPEWLCDGDVDGDGQVNPVDSGLVQAAFGSTDEQDVCNYDVDCDGQINPVDSGIVQSLFGTCEEPREVCP